MVFMGARYTSVTVKLPEVYVAAKNERDKFSQLVQARLCSTLASCQFPDDPANPIDSYKELWPNAAWHFRVIARQMQCTRKGFGLSSHNLDYRPWITPQFPQRSNFVFAEKPVCFHMYREVHKVASGAAAAWKATVAELLQETIEDCLLSKRGAMRKFLHWEKWWVENCYRHNDVCSVWMDTFKRVRDYYYEVELPNVWALARPAFAASIKEEEDDG